MFAIALIASAETLEIPLKAGESVSAALLPSIAQCMAIVVASQSDLLPARAMELSSGSLDTQQRLLLIEGLRMAVSESNPDAQGLAGSPLAATDEGESDHALLPLVIEALDMYDFDSAEKQ